MEINFNCLFVFEHFERKVVGKFGVDSYERMMNAGRSIMNFL